MKNDNQKILLFILGGLLLFTSVVAFIMGTGSSKTPKNEKKEEKEPLVTPILKKEISRLNDTNTMFAIEDALNNFYNELFNNKENAILLLDRSFVSTNQIKEENINEFINATNESVKFYPELVYYNAESNMTYYFVKGYTIDSTVEGENLKYTDNLYYLLKVDMENNYSITPLKDVENLEEYAKDYYLKKIYIDNSSTFKINEISDVNKLQTYITNFKELMYLDNNKAYNILNDNAKLKYNNINVFINDRDYIRERLFDKFDSVNVNESGDMNVYTVQNRNGDTIIITEMYPNDYKIDFNFLEVTEQY